MYFLIGNGAVFVCKYNVIFAYFGRVALVGIFPEFCALFPAYKVHLHNENKNYDEAHHHLNESFGFSSSSATPSSRRGIAPMEAPAIPLIDPYIPEVLSNTFSNCFSLSFQSFSI